MDEDGHAAPTKPVCEADVVDVGVGQQNGLHVVNIAAQRIQKLLELSEVPAEPGIHES
jgi:hypothetical protein